MSFQYLSRVALFALFLAGIFAGSGLLGGCERAEPCLASEVDRFDGDADIRDCAHPQHRLRIIHGKPWCMCPTDAGAP